MVECVQLFIFRNSFFDKVLTRAMHKYKYMFVCINIVGVCILENQIDLKQIKTATFESLDWWKIYKLTSLCAERPTLKRHHFSDIVLPIGRSFVPDIYDASR